MAGVDDGEKQGGELRLGEQIAADIAAGRVQSPYGEKARLDDLRRIGSEIGEVIERHLNLDRDES